ncbi:MAG: lytic transglycosylase domain-containing protein [Candidatus Aminicenantes bacterium]|nr:lytic transglycosylase domain-containing protein [Candidatus Aminicenantes bacterium]
MMKPMKRGFIRIGTLAVAACAVLSAAAPPAPGFPAYLKTKYDPLIRASALRNGLQVGLIHAVIQAESAYNRWAVSEAGAQGLMQLMPATAAFYGVADVFEPVQNIEGGVRYLKDLDRLYDGRTDLILAAYNAGQAAVEKYKGIPPYKETRAYIATVQAAFRKSGSRVRTRLFTVVDADGRKIVTNDPRLARRESR